MNQPYDRRLDYGLRYLLKYRCLICAIKFYIPSFQSTSNGEYTPYCPYCGTKDDVHYAGYATLQGEPLQMSYLIKQTGR